MTLQNLITMRALLAIVLKSIPDVARQARFLVATTDNRAAMAIIPDSGPQSPAFLAGLRQEALASCYWDSESYLGQSARRFGVGELCEDSHMDGAFSIGEDNYHASEPFEYGLPQGEKLSTMCAQAYRQMLRARGMRQQGYVDAIETEVSASEWDGYSPQNVDDSGDEVFAPTLGREDEADEHRHVCGAGMWDGETPARGIEADTLADMRVEYYANAKRLGVLICQPIVGGIMFYYDTCRNLVRGKNETKDGRPVKGSANTTVDILLGIATEGKRIRDERISSVDANAIDRLNCGQKVRLTVTYQTEKLIVDGKIASYDKRDATYIIVGRVRGKDFSVTRDRDGIIAITDLGSDTTEYMRCGKAQRDNHFVDLRVLIANATLTRKGIAWLKYRFDAVIGETNKASYQARGKAIGYSLQGSALLRAIKKVTPRTSKARPINRTSKAQPTGKSNPLAIGPSYYLTKDQMEILEDMVSRALSARSDWTNLTLSEAMAFEAENFPSIVNGNSAGARRGAMSTVGTPVKSRSKKTLRRNGEYQRRDYFPRSQATLRVDVSNGRLTIPRCKVSCQYTTWKSTEKAEDYIPTFIEMRAAQRRVR